METDAALVGTDGIVKLYAITNIVLHLATVVDPGHAECDDAVGLYHALDDFCFFKFGMLVVNVLYADENFLYGLQVLFFAGVLGFKPTQNIINIHGLRF